jgi:hypothetical protein
MRIGFRGFTSQLVILFVSLHFKKKQRGNSCDEFCTRSGQMMAEFVRSNALSQEQAAACEHYVNAHCHLCSALRVTILESST